MSIGPLGGLFASAAGAPLAQSSGSEVDRARQEAAAQKREIKAQEKAADAAGIGQTDGEQHQSHDRDADGRRPWEIAADPRREPNAESADETPRAPADPTGQSGNQLDLTG